MRRRRAAPRKDPRKKRCPIDGLPSASAGAVSSRGLGRIRALSTLDHERPHAEALMTLATVLRHAVKPFTRAPLTSNSVAERLADIRSPVT
jgi:hypothetical protein